MRSSVSEDTFSSKSVVDRTNNNQEQKTAVICDGILSVGTSVRSTYIYSCAYCTTLKPFQCFFTGVLIKNDIP